MKKLSPAGMFAAGIVSALVVTSGGVAVAANGGSVILGKSNIATKKTVFSNNGTPVGFRSRTGSPFTVNSGRKVSGLNADKLDGLDSTALLRAGGKAVDSDKLDGLDSTAFLPSSTASSFLPAGGKAVDSDKVDGVSSEALALASGQTSDVKANGTFVDVNSDGTLDALFASAICPAGSKVTGGGAENFTINDTLVSAPASNGWLVVSIADPAVDAPSDVVAHAVCYNPRGPVGAGTPQGFNASAGGVNLATIKARAAGVLAKR